MGEIGLTVVCALLSGLNLFLVRPEDKTVMWMTRILGGDASVEPLLRLAQQVRNWQRNNFV